MVDVRVDGDFLVVDGAGGEQIRLSLLIPLSKIDVMMDLMEAEEAAGDDESALRQVGAYRRIRREVLPESVSATLESLDDGGLAMQLIGEWSRAIGDRLGKAVSSGATGSDIPSSSQRISGNRSGSGAKKSPRTKRSA